MVIRYSIPVHGTKDSGYTWRSSWFLTMDEPMPDSIVLSFIQDDGYSDISSYADLQRFSSRKNLRGVGDEHPFFHIKETIPISSTMFEGHSSDYWAELPSIDMDAFVDPRPPDGRSNTSLEGTYCRLKHNLYSTSIVVYTNDGWWDYDNAPHSVSVMTTIVSRIEYRAPFYYVYGKQVSYDFTAPIPNLHRWDYGDISNYIDMDFWFSYGLQLAYLKLENEGEDEVYELRPNYYVGPSRNCVFGEFKSEPSDLPFDPWMDYVELRPNHLEPTGLYSKLVGEAMANTSFNSDTIANGLELFDLASSIRSGRIISDIVKKGKIFETSKNAWLAYRYSYSTTLADIEELGRFIEDVGQTICRSGNDVGNGVMQVKIALAPAQSTIKQIVDRLTRYGVAPNLYNLWDMVPFSFVADWFLGLGDYLEQITQYGRAAAYDIKYVTHSWHWYDEITRSGITARIEVYDRQVDETAPPFVPYSSQAGASGSTIIKRVADSVALFT